MTPQNLVAMLVSGINQRYTELGINGVAVAHQSTNGTPVWRVVCEFDTHTELYELGIAPNAGWKFIRLMSEEEVRWAASVTT